MYERIDISQDLAGHALRLSLAGRVAWTFVAKLTFALAPDRAGTLLPPEPIEQVERTHGGHPLRSVEAPIDLAPLPTRPGVVLRGSAVTQSPVSRLELRFAIFRGREAIVDKALVALAEPTGGRPATRFGLEWERALGGPGTWNPHGTEAPTLIDPRAPDAPAGFGPLGRGHPARRKLLAGAAAPDPVRPELPEHFPADYYQCAPPDQRPGALEGGEWLVFQGFFPEAIVVRTQVPLVRPIFRVGEAVVPSAADLLFVDLDRRIATLTFRTAPHLEDGLQGAAIAIGLERGDGTPAFADLVTRACGGAQPEPSAEGTLAVDMALGEPALPFAVDQPAQRRDRAAPERTLPWATSGPVPVPIGEETLALGETPRAETPPAPADRGPPLPRAQEPPLIGPLAAFAGSLESPDPGTSSVGAAAARPLVRGQRVGSAAELLRSFRMPPRPGGGADS